MKRMLSLGPRCGLSGRRLSQLSTQNSPSSVEEEIVIPKRIQRGPTDILRALQSTIHKDPTAPEYKYIDDPFLIPVSSYEKRSYALSKESGRSAARYMLKNFPECFKNNPAEPDIPHFNPPRAPFKADQENTEEDLLLCIDEINLTEAHIVYENLESRGVHVTDETLLKLLQIASFYNDTQPPDGNLLEERNFLQTREPRSSTWKVGGLAEKIFERIENKSAEAYSALIQGMLKYRDTERAHHLYQEMREKGLVPSVHVYNLLLRSVQRLREDHEGRSELLIKLLEEMRDLGVQPNLRTFNSALESSSRLDISRSSDFCIKFLAEMKFLHIEPSLGTYHFILSANYRSHSSSPVIRSIMKQIVDRVWEVRDQSDFAFLPTAMGILANHEPDKNSAYQLLDLAERNPHLFQNSLDQSTFFRYFFKLLCFAEDFDKFMHVYHRFVPNTYAPEVSVLEDVLGSLELQRSYKYLPQLWSDAILMRHSDKETILKQFLALTAAVERGTTEESEKLQKQCVVIARDAFTRILEANKERNKAFRLPITLDAEMISNMLQTYLNGDNMEYVKDTLNYLVKNQNITPGIPSATMLQLLAEKACEAEDKSTALMCAVYSADIGHQTIMDFVREQAVKKNFGDEFLSHLDGESTETKIVE